MTDVFTCRTIRPRIEAAPGGAPSGWGRLNLTFRVGQHPSGIDASSFRDSVADALNIWRTAVPFMFSENSSSGILSVRAVARSHGDNFDFAPDTTELAHAFGPATGGGELDGEVHLNNAKGWAHGSTSDADVLTVVLHELGHALGIVEHVDEPDAVMNGSFARGLVRRTLTSVDIEAMRAAYSRLLT